MLDIESIARALDYLGDRQPRCGQIFICLWARRNRLVSFERIQEEVYLGTGDFISRDSIYCTIARIRSAMTDRKLPVEIVGHYGVGFKLEVDETGATFPAALISIVVEAESETIDRLARLSERFPAVRPKILNLIQVFRNSRGALMSRSEIAQRYFDLTGDKVSLGAIKKRMTTVRSAFREANAPVSISCDYGVGWQLHGDLEGWLASDGQRGTLAADDPSAGRVTSAKETPVLRSRSVPMHKGHFARCVG